MTFSLRLLLAGTGLLLGAAGQALAQGRAAELLPPRPSAMQLMTPSVIRASSEGIVLDSGPAPLVRTRDRDPNFQYPETYSRQEKDPLDISGTWHKITRFRLFGDEKQPQVAKANEPPTAVAHAPAQQPMPVRSPAALLGDAPAWRWYGYGAPVPGRNPYAPAGVYGLVHPNYYHQTGATPGAIPQPLLPTLPQPAPVEPPVQMSRPIDASSPALPNEANVWWEDRPATLQLPVAPVQTSSYNR